MNRTIKLGLGSILFLQTIFGSLSDLFFIATWLRIFFQNINQNTTEHA